MASIDEAYRRAEQLLPWNAAKLVCNAPVVPQWLDGGVFSYRRRTAEGLETVVVDADGGKRRPARSGSAPAAPAPVPLAAADSADGPAGPAILPSHDGRRAVFVKDHDLWLRDLASGEEKELTTDGEPYWDYAGSPEGNMSAVSDRVHGIVRPPVAVWSPDSRRVLTHKLDQRGVPETPMVRHVPPEGVLPELFTYRQNRPGDPVVVTSQLVVVDCETGRSADVQHPPQSATWESPLLMGRAWWSRDGRRAWFIHMGRGERSATLFEHDVAAGTTRTVLTESTETTMDLHPTLGLPPLATVLETSGEVLWFSERDGWGHLYLFDLATGVLKRQLTSGAWLVRDVLLTDETSRFVYLLGAGREPGRDPYYRHLYRVSLDGGEAELLTPEDADHEVYVAPDASVFVDNASTVSGPPVARLRACDGRLITVLEEADVSALDAIGWRRPERFCVKARDGATALYGTLFYPRDFDPAQRYPVVEDIYGWRQTTHAPVRVRAEQDHPFDLFDYWYPQAVAELGFIVVTLDALGTPYRSRAFHEVSYGAAEDVVGLRDHVGALRQLAEQRPYLDLDRVGVYGHSAGGLATALAMLRHPEVYSVGVSSCPGNDMRLYDIDSCEKDLAMFPGGNDGANTNAALLADRLAGRLFIVYGELDDNTHPAMALRLVDALIKAGKPFDLLVMPGANHSLQFEPYFLKRSWDYLVRNLLGEEPPDRVDFRPDDIVLPRCLSTPSVVE